MAKGKKGLGADIINRVVAKTVVRRGMVGVHDLDALSRRAQEANDELLLSLLKESQDTEYGKKYGFASITSVKEYQERVPLSTFDDYYPYIDRMVNQNETNLISARPTVHYALSSGSVGVPKHIPVSQAALDVYAKYTTNLNFAVMDEFYRNTTNHPWASGMIFNAIESKLAYTPNGTPKGPISATLLEPLKGFIPYFMTSPWELLTAQGDVDMKYLKLRFALPVSNVTYMVGAFMTALVDLMDYLRINWEMLCDDIEAGIINPDIKITDELRHSLEEYLAPEPKRAAELRREFSQGFDAPILPRIWPKLQGIGGIGTGGFSAYARKMLKYTGRNIPYNNLDYAASEALMATARHMGDKSYVLIPDSGFYEFIPINDDDCDRCLTLSELEEGEEYELVLTNLSGFWRYRIGDVLRVTGYYNEAPMLEFVYRKSQMLSIAGEKTNEEAVRWSIDEFMRETTEDVVDYSVYANVDTKPGHYVVLMECARVIPQEKIQPYRDIIEAKLSHANPSYGAKVRTGVLGPTELVFVQPETYQLYRDVMIMKGTSPNQLKPVRVIDTPIKERFFFGLRETYEESDS